MKKTLIGDNDEEKHKKNEKENKIDLDIISVEESNLIKQGDYILTNDEQKKSKKISKKIEKS